MPLESKKKIRVTHHLSISLSSSSQLFSLLQQLSSAFYFVPASSSISPRIYDLKVCFSALKIYRLFLSSWAESVLYCWLYIGLCVVSFFSWNSCIIELARFVSILNLCMLSWSICDESKSIIHELLNLLAEKSWWQLSFLNLGDKNLISIWQNTVSRLTDQPTIC